MISRTLATAVAAFLLLLPTSGVGAQSLFSVGGLGAPVEPLDARARGVGSVGVGLFGHTLSARDPAAAAGLLVPTVAVSLQSTSGSGVSPGGSVGLDATRFPLMAAAYPAGERTALTLSYGGFLEQRWTVERSGLVDLPGGPLEVNDTFRSDGGVSTLHLGVARRFGSILGVGVAAGLHTGQIRRTLVREFGIDEDQDQVSPFVASGAWTVTAPTLVAGVTLDPSAFIRIAASAAWSGDLRARPAEDQDDDLESRNFSLPLELRVGVSGRLTPLLSATAGVSWADWGTEGMAGGGAAGEILSWGGGLEWSGSRLLRRTAPMRVGYHATSLPFRVDGRIPSESTLAGGLGLILAEAEGIPLARVEVGMERGSREAGPFSENFWRTTVSLSLSGR